MNIAIVLAGGVGLRVGQDIPKQFINVYGKPILIYTLESLESHPMIDEIGVVCVDGWHDMLKAYAEQFGISKLQWIIPGGASSQDSIKCGIDYLRGKCGNGDIVVIHDGIRPLVDDSVLSDVIITCQKYGNGVTSLPYNEQIFVMDDDLSSTKYIPRDTLRRVSTPQAYEYSIIDKAYQNAYEKKVGIGPSSYANTMMVELGHRIYFAAGSDKNLKITTKDDIELFKGYLKSKKDKTDE